MGMTMTQKILAAHAGLPSVCAGQLIEADLDLVLGNDITSPVAIHEMDKFRPAAFPASAATPPVPLLPAFRSAVPPAFRPAALPAFAATPPAHFCFSARYSS